MFNVLEATVGGIHAAYEAGSLSARQLVAMYLERIEAYDKHGPAINSIITVNREALAEADVLDAAFKSSGQLRGPLHGIPVIIKDQIDVKGMPTTLGSVLFRDFHPDRDAFVIDNLRKAGAILLAKATLGELGAGDTHGSLFGSTRNPYNLSRTVGGSSGGPAAAVAANFGTVAIGQEGLASIRRPASWNCVAGMRPTAGLVSRGGVYSGWPALQGSLGPMARTVTDLARLLEVIVGYDADDPLTAHGVGHIPKSFTAQLSRDALRGARIGILRDSIGYQSEPGSADFAKVDAVFQRSVAELRDAGAVLVDPLVIPDLKVLVSLWAGNPFEEESFARYFGGCANAPFKTRAEVMASPLFAQTVQGVQARWGKTTTAAAHYEYLKARDRLMTLVLQVMADNRLDAIVHKAVEHQPTLIAEGVNPPYVDQKGAPFLNTHLVYVPSVVVPAGFTRDNLPTGITFQGRPYDDARMIGFAYAYEQATQHRRPPPATP
ncbi:MAG: amidase [Burkholderiales bacterium]